MIHGKSYRYFSEQGEDSVKYYSAEEVRFDGEVPVHVGSGAQLREEWVQTDDVRWVDDKPVAPGVDVALEEVIERMAKSRGNVVNPDDVIAEYGADAMRLYEMFIGPLEKAAPWQTEGMPGVFRFLQRVYRLFLEEGDAEDQRRELPDVSGTTEQQRLLARTIDRTGSDFEELAFNTAISHLMVFVRDIEKDGRMPRQIGEAFLRLLAPLAPHLGEELWQLLGHAQSIAYAPWPEADPGLLIDEQVELVVQVQGKVRARIQVAADADEDTVREAALAQENVQKHVGDRTPRKVIYVPGRLVNVVL
jgi:leucyl-tRNA synthetase